MDSEIKMIKVSPEALENIERLQKEYNCSDHGLRFGLSGGGCSGYKYIIEFERNSSPNDIVYSIVDKAYKIDIYISKNHVDKLKNSTICWKSTLMEEGFDIDNPQAKRQCGCGESVNFTEKEGQDNL